MKNPNKDRRDFLKTSAGVAAGVALAAGAVPNVYGKASSDVIKVGLIGCGGRGTGAADNVLNSAKNVQVVAMADTFEDRLGGSLNRLQKLGNSDKVQELGNSVHVPKERQFVGLDAYKKVLALDDVNYVILATPPGFRPEHLQATVAAGKNIFTEKPVGVDGPGIRKVLDAYEVAKKKGLGVAAGTQRRHQTKYLEAMKRIHDGEIGDITSAYCYWNQGSLWSRPKVEGWSDLEWMIRNWLYLTWLSGDHIVEQHVHNIDVCNWALQGHPVKARSLGGRQQRTAEQFGHIFDHFATEYEYENGVIVSSQCRQIPNCWNRVGEMVVGTKGKFDSGGRFTLNDKPVIKRGGDNQPYVQEHTDLIESIRGGSPINELQNVAHSTLTAIMGRMSAYDGREVTWETALNSDLELMPKTVSFDANIKVPKVAIPGETRLF